MSADFIAAAKESLRVLGSQRDAAPIDPGKVSWRDAVLAVLLLAVAQATMLAISAGSALPQILPAFFEQLLMTLAVLAVPFIVAAIAAMLAQRRDELPMLVMYIALCLLLMQVTMFILSYARLSSSLTQVLLTTFIVGRGISIVLKVPVRMAALGGVVAGAGTVALSMALFSLSAGA
jgi:hypothetical protein